MNTSIDQPAARLALVSSQRLILLLILLFAQKSGFGQSEPASVLTKNAYLSNPAQYLSKVNPSLIPSGTFIDRVVYDDLILNVNGKDKVTTIAANDWVRIFNELKYANADTSYLGSISRVERITDLYYEQDMTYPIGILDFNFNRIEQGPLDRGELVEGDEFLDARRAKASSFSKRRVVVASCLSHSIYGDNVNFVVSNLLYAHNIKDQVLVSVEVDFDNGEGFKRVNLSETVQVQYSSASEFLEIKTKLTYQNSATGKVETYYAHSSVFRTGTSTVPLPDAVPTAENGRTYSTPITPKDPIYYPERVTITETECIEKPGNQVCCCETFTRLSTKYSKIVAHILFSPENPSGKLRRPFIITDGFDPGDKRDYYRTKIDISEQLPRDRDERGLYQLVNGDPSPWYSDKEATSPNLIAALRADGYDLVFINFLDGAGDIRTNADYLRTFFNKVLNSSAYRDNKTEEAILVGPSMGGVITRIVMKKMEDAKEDTFVKTWISFDSPQQGANIPIALQQTIKSLKDAALLPAGEKGPLDESLEKLNSPAARQLILSHYSAGGAGTAEHKKLYDDLTILKYPVYSKNYAITNGGTSKLYPTDGSQVIAFGASCVVKVASLFGIGFYLSIPDFDCAIFERTGYGARNVGSQIALDNAPGGWNSALYTFNLDPNNRKAVSETNIPYTKATFIPTTSAFGVKVTQSNVAKTWEYYKANKSLTPFDEIRGMNGISEEHVRISSATRTYLIDELHKDFDNTTRPRVRSGQILSQKVKGKEAITSRLTMTLGGSGNSFTLESSADVVASAGQSITLLPGFTAVAGSNFVAKIATINYSTVLRSAVANLETASVDYTQVSPYTGAVYAYRQDEVVSAIGPDRMEVVAYPNPSEDWVVIQVTGLEEPYAKVEISNALGQMVYQSDQLVNGLNTVNLTKMGSGLYYVKVTYSDSKTKTSKLIKL